MTVTAQAIRLSAADAALNLDYSWGFHALKGHGFSRAVSYCHDGGFSH
jgi:hypothetical protein